MSAITWLHLSDLHFRTGQQHTWDEDIVLRALLKDAREQATSDDLRPDFILVSGDIAFSGKPDEYALAKKFLTELLDLTEVPKQRLFIVPGNHDVDRSAITPMVSAFASTLTSRASLDQLLTTPEDRVLVFRRLRHYANFVQDFFGEHRVFDDEHYLYVERIQVAGQRIALLGLNSAWLSAGDNDQRKLALSDRQVRQALKASQDADWRMALLHHPFDWLWEFDQNDCEDLLMEGCRFILHGHLHRTGLLNLKTPDASAMIIAAGASYEARQSANSYNWVRLDVETGQGTIYLRTYSDRRGGFWTKDTLTYKNASNGEFTFTLPASGKKIGSPKEDTASRAKTMVSTPVVEETARQAALTRYLKNLQRICNALPLAAMSDDADVHRRADITLDRVYIALDTTTRVPLSKAKKKQRKERAALGREEDRALPVLEAANQNARLVIVGDPGSGKSSFVNNLSVLLASARLNQPQMNSAEIASQKTLAMTIPQWSRGALLPVRVLLRELAPALPDEKGLARVSADQRERALCDAVRDHIVKIVDKTFEAANAAPLILDLIAAGQCLIIFDGLDEVSPDRRRLTRQTVETFAAHYRDNRFLVTCRVRSYQNDARLPSFTDVTLAPFDREKINNFVRAWYAAQADLGLMPRERADARAQDLQEAVARLNELAQTPLLLTTMAVVHTAQVELPRERAVLYQRCVELLLRRWHKHKQGESALLVELGLSEAGLLEALWAVAFEAHTRGKPGQAADLPKSDVIKILAKKMGSYANADHFLNHVDERAGLLVGRGGAEESEPVYTFPHRTFQEFLAGCFLALGERHFDRQIRKRLGEGDKWALAAQLGAEHLLYNANDKWSVLDALYELVPPSDPRDENDWRGAVWAGNIAVEMGADAIRTDTDTRDGGDAFLKRLVQRLVKLLEQGLLSPLERADAGKSLAKLGDPRPGVRVRADGLPDILWCEIPAGAFTMGTREQDIPGLRKKYGGDKQWYEWETPQHEEKSITRPYLIGKYPVTNAQYKTFVDAGGYANAQYWQEAIAHGYWKDGKIKKQFESEWRVGAYPYSTPFNLENHPVVGVSWYEAVAFCRWLTEKFSISDFRFSIEKVSDPNLKSAIENRKLKIRLPTEAEWEKAARGPSTPLRSAQDSTSAQDARIFPWDGELTPQHANYNETKIGATSAVGIFPQGKSPYDLLDVSGNVWEWCSTKWIKNYKGYDKKIKERESLDGDDFRVLRGGAFYYGSDLVRAASRDWFDPDGRHWDSGLRVVASLL